MFTGIIEEIGIIEKINKGKFSAVVKVRAKKVTDGTKIGDSIAVNGVCLTVTDIGSDWFTADIMHETLDRSGGGFTEGSEVNLERAMAADGRFGGHIVAGHVDGIGRVTKIRRDDTAIWYTIQADSSIMKYIVEKGSIAVDGISLTVARVDKNNFSVSAIPHTVGITALRNKHEGDSVNLETDIIGKYVEKLIDGKKEEPGKSGITMEFLQKYGF